MIDAPPIVHEYHYGKQERHEVQFLTRAILQLVEGWPCQDKVKSAVLEGLYLRYCTTPTDDGLKRLVDECLFLGYLPEQSS